MSRLKYAVVLASGMADAPIREFSDRTPVEAAHTPALDELAREGKTGGMDPIPADLPPSEEVALLSAFGYDPKRYFTGEACLVCADEGIKLDEGQRAFVHNLATEADGRLIDPAAGHITPKEAEALLRSLSGALGQPDATFRVGRGFAGVTVLPGEEEGPPACLAPEQALGEHLKTSLPRGPGSEALHSLVALSREVFAEHDINRVRADLGENPANVLWPWGPGTPPSLPPFQLVRQMTGAVVAAPGPARGLARLTGMAAPDVTGATGCPRTNYAAKAATALDLLDRHDLVAIHVAAPAEAALAGDLAGKARSIEDMDAMILAPLLQRAKESGNLRILVVATHIACAQEQKRRRGPVPIAMFGPGLESVRHGAFREAAAKDGELTIAPGHEMLAYFLRA